VDLLWPVLILVAAAVAIATFVWHRKRQVERARGEVHRAVAVLQNIEGALRSFVSAGDYIPERVRRPFSTEIRQLTEQNLPGIAKVLRRARDDAVRGELEGVLRHARELRRLLEASGFRIERWDDTTEAATLWFTSLVKKVQAADPPPLGLHVLLGPDFRVMARNLARNLEEGRVLLAQVVART